MRANRLLWAFVLCLLCVASTACGDDDALLTDAADPGDGDGDGDAGDGDAGDGDGDGDGDAGDSDACDVTLEPSDDDTETLQTAFIEAESGDVICLSAGTYRPTVELSLASHLDITLRGTGETREDVVVDFADQDSGDDGIVVTAGGFTIEHMWVKNSPGNGVVVSADHSIFRDLKVSWDAGSVVENGAYAVYPTNCSHTLVENVEVSGASDAGIYVGQCTHAIVRNNRVTQNVLGIEIENTTSADVYGNDIEDNTLGILAVILPNLAKKDGGQVLLHDNHIHDNNRENFATPGTTAGVVAGGAGILVLGLSDLEIRDNLFEDQTGPAIFVASYEILELLTGAISEDEDTDKWPKRVYVHDNMFENTGTEPMGDWQLIMADPVPTVVWDGVIAPSLDTQADMELCLGEEEQMSFLKGGNGVISGIFDPAEQTTDVSDHTCTLDAVPELDP